MWSGDGPTPKPNLASVSVIMGANFGLLLAQAKQPEPAPTPRVVTWTKRGDDWCISILSEAGDWPLPGESATVTRRDGQASVRELDGCLDHVTTPCGKLRTCWSFFQPKTEDPGDYDDDAMGLAFGLGLDWH